jgi:hypothetical protein
LLELECNIFANSLIDSWSKQRSSWHEQVKKHGTLKGALSRKARLTSGNAFDP